LKDKYMILNRTDLKFYLEEDRKALSLPKPSLLGRIKEFLFPNEIWKFEKRLRYLEYYINTSGRNILKMGGVFLYRILFRKQSLKLGFSIPINVCGYGLSIAHYGTIVISANANIGNYCRIHASVNIGASAGRPDAPSIGNNVYIGPGAILFGDIKIADNCTIAANATVNKSFYEQYSVIAGTPAKVVKEGYHNWLEFNRVMV